MDEARKQFSFELLMSRWTYQYATKDVVKWRIKKILLFVFSFAILRLKFLEGTCFGLIRMQNSNAIIQSRKNFSKKVEGFNACWMRNNAMRIAQFER